MIKSKKIMTAVLMASFFLCFVGWSSAEESASSRSQKAIHGTLSLKISVNGLERHYVIHIPDQYPSSRNWPVVIMFHGGGGTSKAAMWETGWIEKADQENFLAVFPEGTSPDPSRPGNFRDNPQTWNDGSSRPSVGAVDREVPDMDFVTALLSDLNSRFRVDKKRIYVTGFSNGASMSFRVARELSTFIAAAAPVAGADWLVKKKPQRFVPLLYITGTADPLNPFLGGEVRIGMRSYGKKTATSEMIGNWIALLNCQTELHIIYDREGAKGTAYYCPGQKESVILYTFEGHGHHWPGGRQDLPEFFAGKNTAEIKATDIIWDFFKSHSLP